MNKPPPAKCHKKSKDHDSSGTRTSKEAALLKLAIDATTLEKSSEALPILDDAVEKGQLCLSLSSGGNGWYTVLSYAISHFLGKMAEWLVKTGGLKLRFEPSADWKHKLCIFVVCGDLEQAQALCPESTWEHIFRLPRVLANMRVDRGQEALYTILPTLMLRNRCGQATVPMGWPNSPMVWAIASGHLHILQWLIKTVGLRPKYLEGGIDAEGHGFECASNDAMCLAAQLDHLHIVQWLCGPEAGLKPNEHFPRAGSFPIEHASSRTKRWFLTRPDCYHKKIRPGCVAVVDSKQKDGVDPSTRRGICADNTFCYRDMDIGDAACQLLAQYVGMHGAGEWAERHWSPQRLLLDGNDRITERGLTVIAEAYAKCCELRSISAPHLHPRIYNKLLAVNNGHPFRIKWNGRVFVNVYKEPQPPSVGPFPTLFAIAMQAVIDRIRSRYSTKKDSAFLPALERQLKGRIPACIYDLIVSRVLPS